ncbi:MAG: flagellar hook capping FlgD N-terminal domain-containing protein [Rhizomicrobium sp.]
MVAPVSATAASSAAYGLDFQSMLKIILTQLTYQDPLKPLDNFEFVSQLGQFAQLQQSQSMNDAITNLLASQAATQATGLLGRTVDLTQQDNTTLSGTVSAVSFASGSPELTIQTSDGQTIANISIANVTQVR